ncbi:hypothetical protein [Luteibacter anthropi]|uniref:hypothetical protein n=1 Tax=Luteibacter anthropi TaxID=564369 RepID=UPI00203221A7|nr:hypothetical protein [Luteibacter anthropi]
MTSRSTPQRSVIATAIFDLLDPVPYGAFVMALIFDATYASTAEILWVKAAAWLITLGLFFAIVPRLINLVQTWGPSRYGSRAAFWLNLFAIVAAVVNALVHTRDAYAAAPQNVWLSAVTVALLFAAAITETVRKSSRKEAPHA